MYAGMDMASGEVVAVAEWLLKWRNFNKKANFSREGVDKEGEGHLKQVGYFRVFISSQG